MAILLDQYAWIRHELDPVTLIVQCGKVLPNHPRQSGGEAIQADLIHVVAQLWQHIE